MVFFIQSRVKAALWDHWCCYHTVNVIKKTSPDYLKTVVPHLLFVFNVIACNRLNHSVYGASLRKIIEWPGSQTRAPYTEWFKQLQAITLQTKSKCAVTTRQAVPKLFDNWANIWSKKSKRANIWEKSLGGQILYQ